MEAALNQLERRCRSVTGMVLAAVAFAATYGILLLEGQSDRPAFHLYPWLVAVLFYLAGDLLALVWFKLVSLQLQSLLKDLEQKQEREAEVQRALFASEDTEETIEV